MNLYFKFTAVSALFLSACNMQDSNINPECYQHVNNKKLFIGELSCFDNFPDIRIEGILTLENEYQILQITNVINGGDYNYNLPKSVWLDFDQNFDLDERLREKSIKKRYKVDIVIKYPQEFGLYGHNGQYNFGAKLVKINSMSLIK